MDAINLETNHVEIPTEIPLLASSQFVLYPFMIAPLLVSDEKVIRMIDDVARGSRIIGVFATRPEEEERGDAGGSFFDRIYEIGSAAMVLRMLRIPDGSLRLLVHGMGRVRIAEQLAEEPYPRARIEQVHDIVVDDNETKALMKNAQEMLAKMAEHSSSLSSDLVVAVNNMDDPGRLADLIASNMSLNLAEQQEILELNDTKRRLLRVEEIMSRELEIAHLGSKIQSQVKSNLDRTQRDYFLREQLKAIRRELGEEADTGEELDQLYAQIQEAGMSEQALAVANKELSRLRSMSPASAEYTVSRTYLDWILALPWSKHTDDNIDLKEAERILNEDHYDLEKIKERILEYLAVIKLRKSIRGPILCLVGPPGVGKTSLGRSVARSMGRKFVRISLGGVRDEAEIRGHRRTYIGALPGRVIKSLKDAGSNNPVFMLDEVDKLGSDYRGDPASGLLEVLDPEQNNSFTDHYLDLPFDLSNVMFITTANTLETIPGPLQDRMEVLHLAGYTLHEKVNIARQYLIPRARNNTGLNPEQIRFTDKALEHIIEYYTREAGLRNLEREITNICRKAARRVAEGELQTEEIGPEEVAKVLGPARFDRDVLADRTHEPGVVIGLAWTPVGGEILFIEATATAGQGHLTLTGQLGDVMKESAQAARTYLHAEAKRLGLAEEMFTKHNIHVHVPAGATPKDGPSAGVAMLTAMASLLRKEPIRERLAMTGEVTLKGTVLPVGGIKEKVLAAHRSGITMLILPKRNEKDLIDVPEEIQHEMSFHFVEKADEVLELAFNHVKEGHRKESRRPRNKAVAGGKGTQSVTAKRAAAGKHSINGEEVPEAVVAQPGGANPRHHARGTARPDRKTRKGGSQ